MRCPSLMSQCIAVFGCSRPRKIITVSVNLPLLSRLLSLPVSTSRSLHLERELKRLLVRAQREREEEEIESRFSI